jgi:hypothetical protein
MISGGSIRVTVSIDQVGGDVVDGVEYIGAGDGSISFDAPIVSVNPVAIPGQPGGGGCGYSTDDGVLLSWTPPVGGASAYDIYAVINTSFVDVSYQGQSTTAGYDDESGLAKENDGGTMSYLIYSVGATGLLSLTPLIVTLTGLPGAAAPVCSYT